MSQLIKQGDLDAASGIRIQGIWGFTEALVFFLEGTGSALFAFFLLVDNTGGLLLGMGLVLVAVLMLLFHLGHPTKAWRAASGIGRSWISMGTVTIGFFLCLSVLYLILESYTGLLDGGYGRGVIKLLLLAACLVILAYPGFTLSASSLPFWSNALLPVTFILSGLATGLWWFFALSLPSGGEAVTLLLINLTLLICLSVSLFSYLAAAKSGSQAAKESSRLVLSGAFAWVFLGLGIGFGIVVPGVLSIVMGAVGYPGGELVMLAALARAAGDVAVRYAFLRAGAYDAVY